MNQTAQETQSHCRSCISVAVSKTWKPCRKIFCHIQLQGQVSLAGNKFNLIFQFIPKNKSSQCLYIHVGMPVIPSLVMFPPNPFKYSCFRQTAHYGDMTASFKIKCPPNIDRTLHANMHFSSQIDAAHSVFVTHLVDKEELSECK